VYWCLVPGYNFIEYKCLTYNIVIIYWRSCICQSLHFLRYKSNVKQKRNI